MTHEEFRKFAQEVKLSISAFNNVIQLADNIANWIDEAGSGSKLSCVSQSHLTS